MIRLNRPLSDFIWIWYVLNIGGERPFLNAMHQAAFSRSMPGGEEAFFSVCLAETQHVICMVEKSFGIKLQTFVRDKSDKFYFWRPVGVGIENASEYMKLRTLIDYSS